MKINEATIVEQLNDNDYVLIAMGNGSLGRIKKTNLLGVASHDYKLGEWRTAGWHRIATHNGSVAIPSHAIFSIANTYGEDGPHQSTFLYSGSGYAQRLVSAIGINGKNFNKVRVVYKSGQEYALYIDVFYNAAGGNSIHLSACNMMNLKLTVEDTIATIPEGYSVQEFDL